MALEGIALRGGDGGGLHKNKTKLIKIVVEFGTMEFAEFNSHIKHASKVIVQGVERDKTKFRVEP